MEQSGKQSTVYGRSADKEPRKNARIAIQISFLESDSVLLVSNYR